MIRFAVILGVVLLNVVVVFAVDTINIRANPEEDVTLPCKVPPNTSVLAVKWTRPDLGAEYVLLNRDGQSDPDNQHPTYKDRVQLKDTEMKDGNVSLRLKNVTRNVTGVYVCQVKETNKSRWKTVANMTLDLCTGGAAGNTENAGNKDGANKDEENKDGANQHRHFGLIPVLIISIVLFGVLIITTLRSYCPILRVKQKFISYC